jgi:hypothetical protein
VPDEGSGNSNEEEEVNEELGVSPLHSGFRANIE